MAGRSSSGLLEDAPEESLSVNDRVGIFFAVTIVRKSFHVRLSSCDGRDTTSFRRNYAYSAPRGNSDWKIILRVRFASMIMTIPPGASL
jgi:hypothetical protein